jgi:hypothetical protein
MIRTRLIDCLHDQVADLTSSAELSPARYQIAIRLIVPAGVKQPDRMQSLLSPPTRTGGEQSAHDTDTNEDILNLLQRLRRD